MHPLDFARDLIITHMLKEVKWVILYSFIS